MQVTITVTKQGFLLRFLDYARPGNPRAVELRPGGIVRAPGGLPDTEVYYSHEGKDGLTVASAPQTSGPITTLESIPYRDGYWIGPLANGSFYRVIPSEEEGQYLYVVVPSPLLPHYAADDEGLRIAGVLIESWGDARPWVDTHAEVWRLHATSADTELLMQALVDGSLEIPQEEQRDVIPLLLQSVAVAPPSTEDS